MKKVIIEQNRFVDSVSLMAVSDKVMKLSGVENVEVVMGTPANLETLESLGFDTSNASSNDLVIAVNATVADDIEAAIALTWELINKGSDDEQVYYSFADIDFEEESYDLAQISLPGEYAYEEAMNALKKGLDVFIFSDNVSLDEELKLKEYGREKGLLVMGPDCGVGLIDGVALAAGSIVKEGPIGIVAASGSGAQEVSCIIEKCGSGVSQILGTGGHDLFPQIGGITMIECMKRLAADEKTQVIVLVSKLAALSVMENVLNIADTINKPTVVVFLGGDENLFEEHEVIGTYSLEEAALKAVDIIKGGTAEFGYTDNEIEEIVEKEIGKYDEKQKFFRGLYCGGTFTEESLIYFSRHNADAQLHTNLNNKYAEKLRDHHESVGHTILDLGSEEFTAEAPHPVFDPALRLKRFKKEIAADSVAVIMLDFITGPGVHEDPITPFALACKEENERRDGAITFIASICGSLEDPQDVRQKEKLLKECGVIVTKSNYQSTKLSSALMKALGKRE